MLGGLIRGKRPERAMRRGGWVPAAIAMAWLTASCAPVPRPGTIPVPPSPRPGPARAQPAAPAPLPIDREPLLDVGLAWDLDSVTVVPARPVAVTGGSGEADIVEECSSPITARLTATAWTITWIAPDGLARGVPIAPAETVRVGEREARAGSRESGPLLGWAGKTWRGCFKIFLNPRGRLTVAARLPLETYLLGVVPGEIGGLSEELLQAGRAQAIAARSYTLFYRGRRGAEGFDLYGTVEDQVYGPVESERPLATRCVHSTRGEVALSRGAPIRANYCSTCGGITADAWEAWPTDPLPYLVSQRDAERNRDHCAQSGTYRWREEWPAEEFLARIASYAPAEGIALPGRGMGELLDVRVESRSRSGRVWRLVAETTTGSVVIPAYSIRRVIRRPGNRGQILRSNLFKVDVRRDPLTRKAAVVVASGAGSGHGVGLCQTGALEMARQGLASERILAHYYPGVELKRMY